MPTTPHNPQQAADQFETAPVGEPKPQDDHQHRHVMDWPQLMAEEGLPIRG
jgi:hypothetical protein